MVKHARCELVIRTFTVHLANQVRDIIIVGMLEPKAIFRQATQAQISLAVVACLEAIFSIGNGTSGGYRGSSADLFSVRSNATRA